ncbi:MAG TPA: MFS transporter [Steroidobacteraceae bacterium]|nr:MFS transporter [Steroidobacteraceae bacterium]
MNRIAETAVPRGWYYGWNIVAATVLSQVAANGLTYNCFSLFVHDWSRDLHAPISQLQLTVAAMVLVAALASPVIGSLADRFPARKLFAPGLLGIALFYVAVSAASAAWQVIALYGLLVPIALGLCTSLTANPLIARWFVRRLGLAIGLSSFGVGMAGVILPPIIAALLPEFGWRALWRTGGFIVALIVMPLVVLVIRDRPTEREGLHYLTGDGSASLQHGHPTGAADPGLSWRQVIARKNFWLLVFIYLPIMAAYGGVAQNLAPYAASRGLPELSAGQLLSILSLAHLAANLVLGLLSDRFGNRLPLVGLALAVATGAAVLVFARGFPAVALGCALAGLGGGVFTLLAAAMAVEFGARAMGRAFGMGMFFLPLGSLAPFAIAKVQESTGSYSPALLSMVAIVMLSAVLSLFLFRERPR